MEGEKTYEMMWDCEYCGSKKLLGVTHRFCPECGAAQNAEKRYFPPDNDKIAVEDHQFVGADKVCPACQEPQSAAVKHCSNCGSPIDGGAAVARQVDQVMGPGGVVAPPPGARPPKAEKKGGVPWLIIAIVVVVLLVIGFVLANKFWTKSAALEVSGHTWTRTIGIERFDEFQEKSPCKDVPSGAKITKRSKGEKKCKTRKVDQGDGTFKEKKECTEPVEQCTYKIKKWKEARKREESGGLKDDPRWPTVSLKKTGKCLGCEREGKRSESYVVKFRDKKSGDTHSCSYGSSAKWKSFERGSKWAGETGMIAGDLKCDKLEKAK
jgi:hypothetical protein